MRRALVALCAVGCADALQLRPQVRAPRHRQRLQRRNLVQPASAQPVEPRPPYALSGLERPKYRGAAMGWLHNTGQWYALSAAYVAAVVQQLPKPLNYGSLALRVALVAASSASVYISDGYHNADKRREGVSEAGELGWLRWDYMGISLILSTNFWLWASNLGWVSGLGALGWASAAATLNIGLWAWGVVPKYFGHVAVKLTLAAQFAGLLLYLVIVALRSPSPACSLIYASYVPGFILYATKFPKKGKFGYHEYFHSSVLLGHLVSMGFDLHLLGLF